MLYESKAEQIYANSTNPINLMSSDDVLVTSYPIQAQYNKVIANGNGLLAANVTIVRIGTTSNLVNEKFIQF